MDSYSQIDELIHTLAQILAKANASFVRAEEDDSHTNLGFDPIGNRLLGRWITHGKQRLILQLNFSDWQFELVNDSYLPLASIPVVGKTLNEIESEVSKAFEKQGLVGDKFNRVMHYEIPNYPQLDGVIIKPSDEALSTWMHYRELAGIGCFRFLEFVAEQKEVRIWPHHFDTGIYTSIRDGVGIGLGLAMKDALVGEAYFYMSGYGLDLSSKTQPEATFWKWISTEGWNGAVLPLSELEKKNKQEQQQFLDSFLGEALRFIAV